VHVIVGLGNPGDEYRGSRHNVGFLVIAGLARESGVRLAAGRGDFLRGLGRVGGRDAALVQPLTFMNRSGAAVVQALREFESGPESLLVVCDDVNLPLGDLRLRRRGGDGGHKGLGSIISSLGSQEFARLRMGVGAPEQKREMVDFVFGQFHCDEAPIVEEAAGRAIEAIKIVLARGIEAAMNTFNCRPEEDDGVQSQEGE
jgi:PTH1 family peptidyl-tRNA hydrolase